MKTGLPAQCARRRVGATGIELASNALLHVGDAALALGWAVWPLSRFGLQLDLMGAGFGRGAGAATCRDNGAVKPVESWSAVDAPHLKKRLAQRAVSALPGRVC
ncbi:hypothetical protein [Roseateles sp. LKC17W]|uniref:Uncharacterized protein n=1 Tax=Pelomonas margarita TaxID=3299031 RepID=A0ABW7FPY8_9BURK